ncbi:MAG: hypothetical protein JWL62_18, partial [Hyphomicrobiales bacterium]|nr:hypothetical protein [Hyphomicrobiales bacterium]
MCRVARVLKEDREAETDSRSVEALAPDAAVSAERRVDPVPAVHAPGAEVPNFARSISGDETGALAQRIATAGA